MTLHAPLTETKNPHVTKYSCRVVEAILSNLNYELYFV